MIFLKASLNRWTGLASERDTYRGNTIENRDVCLFIYVWTYVCHLYFDLLVFLC